MMVKLPNGEWLDPQHVVSIEVVSAGILDAAAAFESFERPSVVVRRSAGPLIRIFCMTNEGAESLKNELSREVKAEVKI